MPDSDSPRPTLRTIARETGLSLGAISLALRNHPSIPRATCQEVQAAARRLGYHPDPKLATLMQHLRTRANVDYHETLAYLSFYENYDAWRRYSQNDYYLGTCERSRDLGYKVEVFHLGEPGMTAARMSRLLSARGIRGIFIGPTDAPECQLNLDWDRFAAVTFGYSVTTPNLHRVTTDYYLGMRTALQKLKAEGFSRIGLNINSKDDKKVLHLWRAAYAHHQETVPLKNRVPVNSTDDGKGNLDAWLRKAAPDAIISSGCDFPQAYEEICGRRPPASIRYINLNILHADKQSSGIDVDSFAVGRLACEHVVAQLQRNEIGLPPRPHVLMIEGVWIENYQAWRRSLGKRTQPQSEPTTT
jgi:LacI family transcriptional regulator